MGLYLFSTLAVQQEHQPEYILGFVWSKIGIQYLLRYINVINAMFSFGHYHDYTDLYNCIFGADMGLHLRALWLRCNKLLVLIGTDE